MKKFYVLGAVVLVAVALIAIAGVAYASIPNNGVITACYLKNGGTLRVIDASVSNCKSSETKLEWNLAGPAGQPGTDGQDGVSGYEIVVKDYNLSAFTSAFGGLAVDCPAGKKVLGGGGAFLSPAGSIAAFGESMISASAPKNDGSGWQIMYSLPLNSPETIENVRVYATCATVQ